MALDKRTVNAASGTADLAVDSIPGAGPAGEALDAPFVKVLWGALDQYQLAALGAALLSASVPVNATPNGTFVAKTITVGTSAVEVRAGGANLANRRRVSVQAHPLNADLIYLGDAAVDPAGDACVVLTPASAPIVLELGPALTLYARSGTAGQKLLCAELA